MQRIVPTRLEKDPTGQAGNRLRAKVEISRRVRSVRDVALQMLDDIPVQRIEINKAEYKYQASPSRLSSLFDELQAAFTKALDLETYKGGWFLNRFLGKAWKEGTTKAFTRLKTIAESAAPDVAEAMNLDSALSSPEYVQRFEIIGSRAFENMKSFGGQASVDLARILGEGVALGKSPRAIASQIRKKFDQIEGYRALRIARTEVNNSFKEARYETTKDARDRLGLNIMIMHVSALVENTRPTHAQRHGNLYTLEEEREWQNEGSNKINCICSTVEVVMINGEPTQKKLIERQKKRGEMYFAMHPEKR